MKLHLVSLLAASSLILGCNQSVENVSQKFNELPPAVQKTARAQAPNAEITSVSRTTENGRDAYEIKFNQNGSNPKVIIAADGTLLNSELPKPAGALQRTLTPTGATGTPFSALPQAVQKTIQSHSPNAQIADIERHENNGRVIYEVEYTDKGKNPTIRVAEDGTLVQDLQK